MHETRDPADKVLVAGAGVGGLTAALACRHAGIDAEVLERSPDDRNLRVGGGLHFWPNGTRAFREAGVVDAVLAVGEEVDWFSWFTASGAPLARADLRATAEKAGAPAVGLKRADLLPALAAAWGTIHFGSAVTDFEQDASAVMLKLADGSERRGSALVGADGLHSTIRKRIVGDSEVRASGIDIYQAAVDADALEDGVVPPRTYGMFWGSGARLGFYPVRGGTFWFIQVARTDGSDVGEADAKARVREVTQGWGSPVPQLIEATREAEIQYAAAVDREPIERWGDGRVTLLGDAAHAMVPFLGQGACQAVEDAVVLARCLRVESDVERALRAYEQRRIPRTHEITNRSWKTRRATRVTKRPVQAIRNRLFGPLFEKVVWKRLERFILEDF